MKEPELPLIYYIQTLHKKPIGQIRKQFDARHIGDLILYLEKLDEYEKAMKTGDIIENPFKKVAEAITKATETIVNNLEEADWEELCKNIKFEGLPDDIGGIDDD